MKRFLCVAGAGLGLLLSASSAHAFIWTINNTLSGGQEVPPNGSPATGSIIGTYDDVANLLSVTTTGSGFVATVTAAHIHTAPPGMNGGVTFPLTGATGGFTYNSVDNFNLSAAQETSLLASGMYVNIHTQEFPGGEIRAQITPVPEPASFVALGSGIALLLALRRRK
jgi:hypothetical protein